MKNLSSIHYVAPNSLARERDMIFARTWQHVGAASAVAEKGQYVAADIAGLKIFVLRGRDGKLRAFKNVCRHRGAQLLEDGQGKCAAVRCPYHQWVFDDKGALINAPWFGEEPGFNKEDWPLEEIHVDQWRGLLFAAIDPELSLIDQLGDLVDELADEPIEKYTCAAQDKVSFDSNWKIYTDNFVEGYHIPGVHPGFFAAIEFKEFQTIARRGLVRMTCPPRDGLFYRGKWLWMWPNWTLSLFDGGMNTSRINPLSVGRTEQLYNFYFADVSEKTAASRADTIERNLAVVREDYEVCVATHKNYETGIYKTGPLSPKHEQGVAYFQSKVAESLGLKEAAE
ncbi:MAG: aromatic ring-hydroxylating dioxygenase subunit alpha [Proteobacteria bacterium]|nr:aromatic ring-hydroxylating dioxygenase subunit alpha [Pseudomonadota bacterium]